MFEEIRVLLSLLILSIAAIQDVRNREVDDYLWMVGISLGGALDAYALVVERPTSTLLVRYLRFSIPFIIVLLASWGLKLMGEADILALITLAVIQPLHPAGKCFFPPAFCSMIYSNLLILLVPIIFLLWNAAHLLKGERIFDGFDEPLPRKIAASILAIAVRKESAEKFKYFTIAEKGSPPKKRFKLASALSIPEKREEVPESRGTLIWICPSIPLLPFILGGYLLTMWVGDPILLLVNLIR